SAPPARALYTLSLHDALPIYAPESPLFDVALWRAGLDEIKASYPRYRLVVEPGRYLVAEAGVLLLSVTQVVEKDGVCRVGADARSEEHTSELQSRENLVCRLL